METIKINTCPAENLETIPEALLAAGTVTFPEAHTDPAMMAKLATALKQEKGDNFVYVPFCLTTEAEALGAKIQLGDGTHGPRVKEYLIDNVPDLLALDFDVPLHTGRLGVTYDAIAALSAEGPVIFNVNGIFALLSSVVDLGVLYKALRTDEAAAMALLRRAKDFLLRVTEEGVKCGASVISYADPVGDITLMGKKMFAKYAAPVVSELITASLAIDGLRLFHLCGRLTNSLYQLDAVDITPLPVNGAASYGEALLQPLQNGGVRFVGNRCIKQTHLKGPAVTMYALCLKEPQQAAG